jgi:glycosyltransferase involved in cell wall biosynthesis
MTAGTTAEKPFVVYWNNIPSPYMVDRFNALADRTSIDFCVWFNDRTAEDRSWTVDESAWRFKYRYMPRTTIAGWTVHWPFPVLGRRPDLLVSLYSEPSFLLGWGIARLRGAKTCFRVLATYDKWVRRRRFKEILKGWLFRCVDAAETPGNDGRRYAMKYGVPEDRVFVATHTIAPTLARQCQLSASQAAEFRRELGVQGTVFLYVGRLWWGKGLRYLLQAFQRVQRERKDVSLLIVGDGPDLTLLEQQCRELCLSSVTFVGFKQREALPAYYAAADVLVFPTLGDPYGLVVDEALACSLPVISTDAVGEIADRIHDGVNGFIVPSEDSSALAAAMGRLAGDESLRGSMASAAVATVADRTPERWATEFENMAHEVLAREPAVSPRIAGRWLAAGDVREASSGGNEKPAVAVVWSSFGPYHVSRCEGVVAATGQMYDVVGIELAGRSRTYSWNAITRDVSFVRRTLSPGAVEDLSPLRAFMLLRRAFKEAGCTAAFLESYWPARNLACVAAAKSLGLRTVMMNDSHDGTARARGLALSIKKMLVRRFDAALVGGERHRQYFASLGLPRERIFVGYDAVDNHYFAQAAASARARAAALRAAYGLPGRYVLSVGRMVSKKNLSVLIRACALLKDARGSAFPVVFVGSGTEEDGLKRLAADLGLRVVDRTVDRSTAEGDVFFYGFRQIDENPVFYALAEAFVLPSIAEEWGLVVNEAMACATPVIVSRNAGAAELVREGLNGYRFDAAAAEDLARVMNAFVVDPHLASRLGQTAAADIKHWGCERFGEEVLHAMQTLEHVSVGS